MSEKWLPIESAPRNGDTILASDGYEMWAVRWTKLLLGGEYHGWTSSLADVGRTFSPTYWQPIELPPLTPEQVRRAAEYSSMQNRAYQDLRGLTASLQPSDQ